MAYIFDPIRNTFVDDEDTSLGNKLALNDEEFEKLLKIPGVFRASEVPQPPPRQEVLDREAIKKFKIKKDKVDEIVDNINNMESIAAMKEMNNVIARQGKYRGLTDDEVEKIYEATINRTSGRADYEDPFFKGDVEDQFDIEAFAKQLEKSKKDSDHKAKMKRLYEGPGS